MLDPRRVPLTVGREREMGLSGEALGMGFEKYTRFLRQRKAYRHEGGKRARLWGLAITQSQDDSTHHG